MRKALVGLWVLVVACVSVVGADCSVEALFVSPAVDEVIEGRLIEAITCAEEELLVAMYSFTDDDIGLALVTAHDRGVKVYVLLDDGQDSDSQGREYPSLINAGIPVGVEHVTGLLHHKFVVIDRETVITGSYNWSNSADESNFENAVVIDCSEIAEAYACEFVYIANNVLGLGWPIAASFNGNGGNGEKTACERCLERINAASRSRLEDAYGIGPTLSQRLVAAQPFSVWSCTGRSSVEAALQGVDGIGPAKSSAIVDELCGDLFD